MKKQLYLLAFCTFTSMTSSYAMKITPEKIAAIIARQNALDDSFQLPTPEFLARNRGKVIELPIYLSDRRIDEIINQHTFDDNVEINYVHSKDFKTTSVTIKFVPKS